MAKLQRIPKNVLDLPVELILSVCDFLSLDNRACLALTCHQLYHCIGSRIFMHLDSDGARFEKAAFLQQLQRDRPDIKLWLCYGCLRFHPTHNHYDPPNFRTLPRKRMPGFPYCQSTYAKALDEIHARLQSPWTTWSKQMERMEDDINSPVRMSVFISCIANSTDLVLRRRYLIDCTQRDSDTSKMSLSHVEKLLRTLESLNLGICPHFCFAKSWRKGDGSIISKLSEHQEEDYWT